MKKLVALLLVAMLALSMMPAMAENVELTMGSWRSDDAVQVQAMLDKYFEKTGVKITFQPTVPDQYNATLRLQLDNGTGPDLFYSRSYAAGAELFGLGFNMDLSDLPGVKENFTPASIEPFADAEGKVFAVPYAAVNHVVYYNVDTFAKYNLTVPQTFEELLALSQTLKDNGETPFANGIASNWDILECVFSGMVPNYIGGPENRAKYESGEWKMNDENFVAALTDFEKLSKFFPEGFESVTNENGPDMMALGRAVMLIDGSWQSGLLKDTNWGAFAIPAPEGKEPGMCFHPDMGLAGNNATKHPEEVKAFLSWVASPEGAVEVAASLPGGFFPMINAPVELTDPKVNEVLAANQGRVTDARFFWSKLMPMYKVMVEELNALAKGEKTVAEVAEVFAAEQAKTLGQ